MAQIICIANQKGGVGKTTTAVNLSYLAAQAGDRTLICDLDPEAEKKYVYQQYVKDYMRVVASVDDNVGRMLDFLDTSGLAKDTVVIYTTDNGMFLGDHGMFDKRWMHEQALRIPLLVRYPREMISSYAAFSARNFSCATRW